MSEYPWNEKNNTFTWLGSLYNPLYIFPVNAKSLFLRIYFPSFWVSVTIAFLPSSALYKKYGLVNSFLDWEKSRLSHLFQPNLLLLANTPSQLIDWSYTEEILMQYYTITEEYTDECTENQAFKSFALTCGTDTWSMLVIP